MIMIIKHQQFRTAPFNMVNNKCIQWMKLLLTLTILFLFGFSLNKFNLAIKYISNLFLFCIPTSIFVFIHWLFYCKTMKKNENILGTWSWYYTGLFSGVLICKHFLSKINTLKSNRANSQRWNMKMIVRIMILI